MGRDDSQTSSSARKAVRVPAFNPGAFVTRVTHFTAPHAPAIPSRNVQDPARRGPSSSPMPSATLPPLLPPLLVIPAHRHLSLLTRVTERAEETGHVTKEG